MDHKIFAKKYFTLIVLISIFGFCFWFFFWRFYKYTDDAYVQGNQIVITPLVPSFVKAIHTDDTYLIKKGQLLIELDDTDAKLALGRARDYLANTVREVCSLYHQTFSYSAEIELKKALLIKAEQDLEHRKNVVIQGGVSVEDYEHAVAAFRESFFSLKMTEEDYQKNLSLISGVSIRNHPQILDAIEKYVTSWVNLYRCKIYSPVEGLGAQRTIQVGKWVNPGDYLMSVIPLDQIWVNANYKETQMKHMRIGQPAKVTADYFGKTVVFNGVVLGIPGGAGNAFSILPPQNLSGNWIKIVQRLPVRIGLNPEMIKKYPLRIGLSMEVVVNVHDTNLDMVPDSTIGSPLYETPIYAIEETGSYESANEIFEFNFDSKLEKWKYTPFDINEK
jgi:membrane fusion protein (multidrug efflux system)